MSNYQHISTSYKQGEIKGIYDSYLSEQTTPKCQSVEQESVQALRVMPLCQTSVPRWPAYENVARRLHQRGRWWQDSAACMYLLWKHDCCQHQHSQILTIAYRHQIMAEQTSIIVVFDSLLLSFFSIIFDVKIYSCSKHIMFSWTVQKHTGISQNYLLRYQGTYLAIKRPTIHICWTPISSIAMLSNSLIQNSSRITKYAPYFWQSVKKYRLLIWGAMKDTPACRTLHK